MNKPQLLVLNTVNESTEHLICLFNLSATAQTYHISPSL